MIASNSCDSEAVESNRDKKNRYQIPHVSSATHSKIEGPGTDSSDIAICHK